jgi:hypothetical protein
MVLMSLVLLSRSHLTPQTKGLTMKKVAIKVELTEKEFDAMKKVCKTSVSDFMTDAVKNFLKQVDIHRASKKACA